MNCRNYFNKVTSNSLESSSIQEFTKYLFVGFLWTCVMCLAGRDMSGKKRQNITGDKLLDIFFLIQITVSGIYRFLNIDPDTDNCLVYKFYNSHTIKISYVPAQSLAES